MKVVTTVTEVNGEGLLAFMGDTVTLFCDTYIYTGKLVGINETCVKLENAGIVYETGPLTDKKWADMQPLPNGCWYVQISKIESFGKMK